MKMTAAADSRIAGPEGFPGMNEGCGEGPDRYDLILNDLVFRIEEGAPEHLFLGVLHPRLIVRADVSARAERRAGQARLLVPPPQLDRGLDLRDLGRADAFDAVLPAKLADTCLCYAVQSSELFEQFDAQIDRGAAVSSVPDDDSEKLCVGKSLDAVFQEPLSRPLVFRPLLDAFFSFIGHRLAPPLKRAVPAAHEVIIETMRNPVKQISTDENAGTAIRPEGLRQRTDRCNEKRRPAAALRLLHRAGCHILTNASLGALQIGQLQSSGRSSNFVPSWASS